jgi:RHS repeat-associated protein
VAQIEHAGGGTKTKYLLQDRLGSAAAVLNQTGEVVERLFYASHGERLNAAGAAVGGSAAGLRPGFTGHEHDDDLGLINMRGRVYDPGLRRFLSPDPSIGQAANGLGIDRYAYVANDPFNRVDPTGLQDFPPPGETEVDVWYEGEPPDWCYACNEISYYDKPDKPTGGDSSAGGGYVEPFASASYDPGAGQPASEAPEDSDQPEGPNPYFHGPCPPSCGGDYIGPEGAVIILTVTGLRIPFFAARHPTAVGQLLARTAPVAQTLQTGLIGIAESAAGGAIGVGTGALASASTLSATGGSSGTANQIVSGAGHAIDDAAQWSSTVNKNSYSSTAEQWLYAIVSKAGEVLKYGTTYNQKTRYSKEAMAELMKAKADAQGRQQ